jgi:hypothetical protein
MKRRDKQMFIAPASMPLPMQGLPSSVAPTTPATLCKVSAAGAPPGTHGKLTCSETALSGGSGGTDAGPTSQQSQIDIQVRTATADIACNTHTEGLLLEAWTAYRTFTERRGTLPARLEDISPADLARFVAHARSAQQNIDALLMMLTMLGSLLVHAGYNRLRYGESACRMPVTANTAMRSGSWSRTQGGAPIQKTSVEHARKAGQVATLQRHHCTGLPCFYRPVWHSPWAEG